MGSRTNNYWAWLLGFGLLAGLGIGFGYSSATPPSLKWFPPSKTGLIAGLVVAGFGLASVYIAPLSEYLLNHFGVLLAMLFYSIFFVVVVCGLSTLLVNPPPGYVPGVSSTAGSTAAKPAAAMGAHNPEKAWLVFDYQNRAVSLTVVLHKLYTTP